MDTSIMVWTGVGPLAFHIEHYIIFTADVIKPVDCLDKGAAAPLSQGLCSAENDADLHPLIEIAFLFPELNFRDVKAERRDTGTPFGGILS